MGRFVKRGKLTCIHRKVRVRSKERVKLVHLIGREPALDAIEQPGLICAAIQLHRTISSLPMYSFKAVRPR